MKHTILLTIILMISSASFNLNAKVIPASSPLIEYTGRIDFSNLDAPKFSYSGVSVRASFKGTSISAILEDEKSENHFTIILDKTIISRLTVKKGKQSYILAKDLENKVHEIEIFRNTEEMFGKTSFCGFDVEGTLVEIENKRTRMIEFIGNSITCGYGNEGELGATFGASTENHYMTYAALTSRNFNARHLAVCKSGIGIYRNYNGPATGSPDCMPNYYPRIFLWDANPKYKFKEKPDLICIDLGTNDFSTNGGDSARYVSGYLNFIDSLQRYYKNPDILCLLGPMINGSTLARVRGYIKFVVTMANNRGKGNVHFFEMSAQTGDLGIGIDTHPTVAQHIRNSRELTAYISTLKQWDVKPLVIKAEVETPNKLSLQFSTEMNVPAGSVPGFTVTVAGKTNAITEVYKDATDNTKIYIILEDFIKPEQLVELTYQKGLLSGKGNMLVEPINKLFVENQMMPNVR